MKVVNTALAERLSGVCEGLKDVAFQFLIFSGVQDQFADREMSRRPDRFIVGVTDSTAVGHFVIGLQGYFGTEPERSETWYIVSHAGDLIEAGRNLHISFLNPRPREEENFLPFEQDDEDGKKLLADEFLEVLTATEGRGVKLTDHQAAEYDVTAYYEAEMRKTGSRDL